jgi:transposase
MPQANSIRDMAKDGHSIAEIGRVMKVDEKTVRKYVNQEDFSPKPPRRSEAPSILDPHKHLIDQWLDEDRNRWHKQRHTAKRIFDRLAKESQGFSCSYNTVQRYVKQSRAKLRETKGTQELVWHAGESQADFGEADFFERGTEVRKKYLTLSFPYSNDSFTQIFGGETAECVCQGLKDIFAYIGGVPPVIVFDNATGVGRRIGEVIHEAEVFERFRAHYRFSVRFCNPASGHEKGNVESKIGYTRRNLFVPPAGYDDIEQFNRELLDQHEQKACESHYKKGIPIRELFLADCAALMRLPAAPFDVCRYEYQKTDGYGKIRVDGRHFYSSSPEHAGREVLAVIRAHTVEILDERKQLIVRHERYFGTQRSDHCDYRTSVAMLLKNPGAWKNSGVRESVPDSLRQVMDRQSREELRSTLKAMKQLTTTYSFEIALAALSEGIRINRNAFCDAAVLAARISSYGLDTPPDCGQDLSVYDRLLEEAQPV